MADPITTEQFVQDLAGCEDPDPAHPITTAQLLDSLLGLQAAFRQCNEFAISPSSTTGSGPSSRPLAPRPLASSGRWWAR